MNATNESEFGGQLQLASIISGGQTGVDQGALRAALVHGVAIGGWCPPGRDCDAGRIPDVFRLKETPEERSLNAPEIPRSQRTEWNVRDSDATLVLAPATLDKLDRGTGWTCECARRFGKPMLTCDPGDAGGIERVREWLVQNGTRTLNIAGPSERAVPGVGVVAERFVSQLLLLLQSCSVRGDRHRLDA